MAKKQAGNKGTEKTSTDKNSEQDQHLSEKIRESARQIWLAGLGAYNKAEEDTEKFFEKLVKEGEEIENMTRGAVEKQFKAVEDTVDGVKDRVGEVRGRVEGVRERASDTFGKLENVFDQRVSAALVRLGIPSKQQIKDLEARVAELEAKLKK